MNFIIKNIINDLDSNLQSIKYIINDCTAIVTVLSHKLTKYQYQYFNLEYYDIGSNHYFPSFK